MFDPEGDELASLRRQLFERTRERDEARARAVSTTQELLIDELRLSLVEVSKHRDRLLGELTRAGSTIVAVEHTATVVVGMYWDLCATAKYRCCAFCGLRDVREGADLEAHMGSCEKHPLGKTRRALRGTFDLLSDIAAAGACDLHDHDEGCSEDDTCDCSIRPAVDKFNAVCAAAEEALR